MAMKYIGGYLLSVLGGNEEPTADDVSSVLAAAGIEVDTSMLSTVVKQCKGKSVSELIAAGQGKLEACGGGGGGGGGGAGAAAGGGGDAGGAAAEEKKVEEEEEEEEMDFDLFG